MRRSSFPLQKIRTKTIPMNNPILTDQLASDIIDLYHSDVSNAETLIEGYLKQRLEGLSPSESLEVIDTLTHEFKPVISQKTSALKTGPDLVAKLFSLFLGKEVSDIDLSSAEFLERLAGSLNTVFDSLNELIGVINVTLLGKQSKSETIRQIIGSNLHEEVERSSLETYLAQIKEAFLVSHQAFKKAAQIKVKEIILELDPRRIEESEHGGLRLGPLKKANLFETYQLKFQRVQKWFESGRFEEELLRNFESICEKSLHDRRELK